MSRPVFGRDRDPGVVQSMIAPLPGQKRARRPFPKVNPMLMLGAGPAGAKCRTCIHLVKANLDTARGGFLKCEERGISGGEGTDHRAKWDACALYELRLP